MHDMLVRLVHLQAAEPLVHKTWEEHGVLVRPCRPYELHLLQRWVRGNFSSKWVSEATVAMSHCPPACFIATRQARIVGFACYDTTSRGFFGPMGVSEELRGCGVGRTLLVAALQRMREMGYAYAIIGGVGPADFYRKVVGATDIEESTPGIYEDMLNEE